MKNVILMGIKHCGKTTQGRLLSAHYGCDFFDTDDLVVEMTGMTPREIYSDFGKEAFLKAESDACNVIAGRQGFFVVSTGGGICMNDKAVGYLRGVGTFVFLDSDETVACDRIIKEIKILPGGKMEGVPAYIARENPSTIDDVRRSFHSFYEERRAIYSSICDVTVTMLPLSKMENMARIIERIESL